MAYTKYTPEELDDAALRDLIADANFAEDQAANGPFYPERGITRQSCLAYAAKCRAQVELWKTGGAHKHLLES